MTQDTKDKSSEALQRLEMLLAMGWVMTSITFPDYRVVIRNMFATECVKGYGPDLATAIIIAVDLAAITDPTFRDFEKAVRDDAALTAAVIANCTADVLEGKYDNWQPKPKPPIGTQKVGD